tara:strand:+ start:9373 stop:10320 length:948 start_codon:yes stop_codon:yes gene_type:complete
MKIVKYQNNEHLKIWDKYVQKSNNGTIFHLRKFLSYHQERNFKDCSLMFYDKDTIKGIFSGAIVNHCLYSHPGASFGGFVYNDLSFESSKKMVELLIQYALKNQLTEIVIIPPPFIYYNLYNEAMEYCLHYKGFNIEEYYISSFVDLRGDIKNQIHSRKKRYIRKIENNIIVKESKNLEDFYPILLDNKSRHDTKPTHTLEELKILMDKFPNNIILLLSYYENKIIGGALNFITNNNSCILFYNMIDYNYKDLQSASLQIYKSLEWAKKNGLYYLDIGVSQLYEGNQIIPHDSLINFKEQFGAKAMIRKVMKLKL